MVTSLSPDEIYSDNIFKTVVLPDPVPPDTIIFFLVRTQAFKNSLIVKFKALNFNRSSVIRRVLPNFLIVRVGPVKDNGGIMALIRDPSARRASTIGFDSSILLPKGAIIRSITCRTCSLVEKLLAVSCN